MIDLRSDTVTKPTEEMLKAMSLAEVGDDVYEDDPTVNRLQELAAHRVGKEAALFAPSGTMCNQLAIMAHTRHGDEIIVDKNSHIVVHEVGATAVLSGVNLNQVNNKELSVTKEDVLKNIRNDDIHYPRTSLVCMENALGNGTVVPLQTMKGTYEVAKQKNIPIHLDGARIFNAATYLNVDVKELTKYCDTLMFCVSKGLCAPVGSLLCGDKEFIKKARRYRKLLGGGMRQIGVLAAAGIIGMEKMIMRLDDDHENAKILANLLKQLPNVQIDINKVHINMLFFKLKDKNGNFVKEKTFVNHMLNNGIKINDTEDGELFRFVIHNGIRREDIELIIKAIKEYLK